VAMGMVDEVAGFSLVSSGFFGGVPVMMWECAMAVNSADGEDLLEVQCRWKHFTKSECI
jgi:hypothetical protein